MPSRAKLTSKKFLSTTPLGKEVLTLLNELHFLDDRSMAIVGGAIFAEVFRRLVQSKMREDMSAEDNNRMFDPRQGGFLSTLDAQLRLAHSLKWISDDLFEDALIIQGIRNVFAHSLYSLSFEDQSIKADCQKLKLKTPAEKFDSNPVPNKTIEFIWYRNWIFIWVFLVASIASKKPLSGQSKYLLGLQPENIENILSLPNEFLGDLMNAMIKQGSEYIKETFGPSSKK